ncbi:peptidase T [Spirochaetia bacterium]|nr:peptidase T [Spirochaetia bacterium]
MSGYIDLVLPRFLRYVRYGTASDSANLSVTPTTPGQWTLARALVQELQDLGVDASLTDSCYVLARLPASAGREHAPTIGFLAHLDTSDEVSGENVTPILVENYDGNPIQLAAGICLDSEKEPDLAAHIGRAIVHSDGTTLLGADDKAGIAAIIGAVEYLLQNPDIAHGPVEIIFSPDEETGKGLPAFPRDQIHAVACYTVDGGAQGELESECFNAYHAAVSFRGRVTHLGTARGVLVNAALMAAAFAALLPRSESPEATDGYYGYYCVTGIRGDLEKAEIEVFIRDFDRKNAENRCESLKYFAKAVEAQFPGGTVEVNIKEQYLNMKEKIALRPEVVTLLKEAYIRAGVDPRIQPIRGGTDGSRLTEMGIPTPNIFTGGRNFHSRSEWLSVDEMATASALVVELIRLWGEA